MTRPRSRSDWFGKSSSMNSACPSSCACRSAPALSAHTAGIFCMRPSPQWYMPGLLTRIVWFDPPCRPARVSLCRKLPHVVSRQLARLPGCPNFGTLISLSTPWSQTIRTPARTEPIASCLAFVTVACFIIDMRRSPGTGAGMAEDGLSSCYSTDILLPCALRCASCVESTSLSHTSLPLDLWFLVPFVPLLRSCGLYSYISDLHEGISDLPHCLNFNLCAAQILRNPLQKLALRQTDNFQRGFPIGSRLLCKLPQPM